MQAVICETEAWVSFGVSVWICHGAGPHGTPPIAVMATLGMFDCYCVMDALDCDPSGSLVDDYDAMIPLAA